MQLACYHYKQIESDRWRHTVHETHITELFVKSTNTPGTYRDTEVTGFQFVIGKRKKMYKCRVKAYGKTLRVHIADVDKISLSDARKAAIKLISEIKAGERGIVLDSRQRLLWYTLALTNRLGGKVQITAAELDKLKRSKMVSITETADGGISLTVMTKR